MKKIKLNSLFALALEETGFLMSLPADPKEPFNSKQKMQLNAIFYKYFGTIPMDRYEQLMSAARQSRKTFGNADAQRIILITLAAFHPEPTTEYLFTLITHVSPLLFARLFAEAYILVDEFGLQQDIIPKPCMWAVPTPVPLPPAKHSFHPTDVERELIVMDAHEVIKKEGMAIAILENQAEGFVTFLYDYLMNRGENDRTAPSYSSTLFEGIQAYIADSLDNDLPFGPHANNAGEGALDHGQKANEAIMEPTFTTEQRADLFAKIGKVAKAKRIKTDIPSDESPALVESLLHKLFNNPVSTTQEEDAVILEGIKEFLASHGKNANIVTEG